MDKTNLTFQELFDLLVEEGNLYEDDLVNKLAPHSYVKVQHYVYFKMYAYYLINLNDGIAIFPIYEIRTKTSNYGAEDSIKMEDARLLTAEDKEFVKETILKYERKADILKQLKWSFEGERTFKRDEEYSPEILEKLNELDVISTSEISDHFSTYEVFPHETEEYLGYIIMFTRESNVKFTYHAAEMNLAEIFERKDFKRIKGDEFYDGLIEYYNKLCEKLQNMIH